MTMYMESKMLYEEFEYDLGDVVHVVLDNGSEMEGTVVYFDMEGFEAEEDTLGMSLTDGSQTEVEFSHITKAYAV